MKDWQLALAAFVVLMVLVTFLAANILIETVEWFID